MDSNDLHQILLALEAQLLFIGSRVINQLLFIPIE